MSIYSTKEAKRYWAWKNVEKVREANRIYRAMNKAKTNRQAAERMRKMRAKIRRQKEQR